jgi:hypothetical protein
VIVSPPFSLIFEQSIEATGKSLAALVDASSDVFVDGAHDESGRSSKLLFEGLSFVLTRCSVPESLASFRPIFFSKSLSNLVSVITIEFGPNLADGMVVPALARGYLKFVAKLVELLRPSAVAANEAGLICDSTYFAEAVNAYLLGGAFPALATIAYDPMEKDGAILTRGLSLFAGQEIMFDGKGWPETEIMRRMVRLVHDICTNGPVCENQLISDIQPEFQLQLEPNAEQAVLNISVHFGASSDFVGSH